MLLWNLKPGSVVSFGSVKFHLLTIVGRSIRIGVECEPDIKFEFANPKAVCHNETQGISEASKAHLGLAVAAKQQ